MPFERFAETGRGYSPRASMSKAGLIGLNKGAVQRYDVDIYKLCVLYFDRETRRIGIEFTNDADARGARPIRKGKAGGAFIGAKNFLEYYDIAPSATTLIPVDRDEEANLLVLELGRGTLRGSKKK